MKKKAVLSLLVLTCILTGLTGHALLLGTIQTKDFETGKIIERITCLANQEQSYSLYLPANYTVDKKWPIMYTFEPGARTKVPLELFRQVAEQYGYILVCSHNIHNGPWQEIITAMQALWLDTNQRFQLDTNRILTAGFSGGARAAVLFPHVIKQPVSGIIGCGAGLPGGITAKQLQPAFYYGIVGLEDFNYKEMTGLSKELEAAGTGFVLEVIDGPHRWPPTEVCSRAAEWMEIWALTASQGSLPDGEKRVKDWTGEIFQKIKGAGQAMHNSGKIYYAAAYYRAAAALFKKLENTRTNTTGNAGESTGGHSAAAELAALAAGLESSAGYREFIRAESVRNRKELDYIGRFAYVFSLLRSSADGGIPGSLNKKVNQAIKDLDIVELLQEAKRDGEKYVFDRAMATRLLQELVIKADREGEQYLDKRQYKQAELFFEIELKASQNGASALYGLACLEALQGNKKDALDYLESAVEKLLQQGYRDFSFIVTDKRLESLKKEQRFVLILEKINKVKE